MAEMDAGHVSAWLKGGSTDINNCQMFCKTHNRTMEINDTFMKNLLNYHVAILLIAVFSAMALCSCGDDDDDVVLESYIVGSWHSFKAIVHSNGETETLKISKTGDWSMGYFEFDFENDGTVVFHSWVQDQHGLSHWAYDNCTYAVRGDEVRVRDSGGNIISLFFDTKDKTLYVRTSNNSYGTQVTTYIYLRK